MIRYAYRGQERGFDRFAGTLDAGQRDLFRSCCGSAASKKDRAALSPGSDEDADHLVIE
jgi:hypothetical protein